VRHVWDRRRKAIGAKTGARRPVPDDRFQTTGSRQPVPDNRQSQTRMAAFFVLTAYPKALACIGCPDEVPQVVVAKVGRTLTQ